MLKNKNLSLLFLGLALVLGIAACDLLDETEPTLAVPVVETSSPLVSATGVLVPAVSANLSMAMPGVVDAVFVVEGQNVRAGEQLISLSSTAQAAAALSAAELELLAAQQAHDELHDNTDLASANSWLALLDARANYILAEKAWDELDKDDYQDDIDDAQEDVLAAEEDLEDAQKTFNRYADLDEDNALRKRYESDLQDAQVEYNKKVRAHSELIIDLERTEANWKAASAAVDRAQTDYEATLSGPDLDLLAMVEARLTAAEAHLAAAQAQVDDLTLTAPFDGTVVKVNINPGEYAAPGQPIVVIADLDNLHIETTDLNEIDVVEIKVGDLVMVTFDAIAGEEFSGTVTEISSKSSEGLGVNYTVVIKLDVIPAKARWGMTAFVDVEIGN